VCHNESVKVRIFSPVFLKKAALRFGEATAIVILAFLLSRWLHEPIPKELDDSATINLYLTEHQGAILQNVSQDSSAQLKPQMSVSRDEILYFEQIDGFSRRSRPGMILKGPEESHRRSDPPELSEIPTGEALTLSQARSAVDFEPAAPLVIHPAYVLDSIRKIKGRNSLHLVYTNGIDSFSLFQQPLKGDLGLAAREFREFAIYQTLEPGSKEVGMPDKATILAWSDGSLSLVLIGKMGVAQMMDIAHSIPAVIQENSGLQEQRGVIK
jgi:hypothetical protein